MEPLKGGKVPLHILVRGKDADFNNKLFIQINDAIKTAGKKIGVLTKDNSNGPFIDEWKKVYADISSEVEEVDIASALSAAALAVKDQNELVCGAALTGRSTADFVLSVLCEAPQRHVSL